MSELISDLFRSSRQRGLSHEDSVNRVYQAGVLSSSKPKHLSSEELADGHTIYIMGTITGLSPNEALDEVFLAGYHAATTGAFGELEAAL